MQNIFLHGKVWRIKMNENDKVLIDGKIKELKKDIEEKREQNFINLLIEIIVTITLKELNEKSD
ncbi:hypothetical protein ACYE2N_04535 [Flavobacterium sp. MAHUQ-51]|uniref:hypothetical protein n=1 Tax=Flavobacterium sp. GCM10022190 TaxID=3252639 RepID=UPI003623DB37